MPLAARTWLCTAGLAVLAALPLAAQADVVFENVRVRAVLGQDAVWRSVIDKACGKDHGAAGAKVRFASARIGGKWHEANAAHRDGDRLTVGFAGIDTRLLYAVTTQPDWIALHLEKVEGTRPTHLILVRIGLTLTEHVGPRLNGCWDDTCAVCLTATNLQTEGKARRHTGYAELACSTQDTPGPRLEGAGAALVAAPTPHLRGILQRLAAAYDLPRNEGDGVPSKDLPVARRSYWFLRFGEADVEKVIDLCRRTGLQQVMMLSHSWCRTVGHYTFDKAAYPDGIDSLRRTVARLHDAGILVGMHGYASKISKTDSYVTPVPDRRFWVDRTAALAADIGPQDTAIRTSTDLREWPGSPVAKQKTWEGGVAKHRETIIDDEIVRYQAVGPEGTWNTFLGCERGAWGTRAAAHKAGTACRHYGVDGCINGYIIDQETPLLDEATARLAHVFNTCGFDMVYFDGGEDVDRRRFTHYVSKFQAAAMSKFTKRPILHMGTIMTHNLWHSFTRSGTVDTYANTIRGRLIAGGTWDRLPTVKEHIDRSVERLLQCREDRLTGELGWFGIWPRSKDFEGLQLDEIEYLMAKSLAYDAPISLQTSFASMDRHPLTPGILEIVQAYETVRQSGWRDDSELARLRAKGRDFVMILPKPSSRRRGPWFVEVDRVANVAGTTDIRALISKEPSAGAVLTLWHATGKPGRLLVKADADGVSATDIFGKTIDLPDADGENVAIPFGHRRTTVRFGGLKADVVRERLAAGHVQY